MSGYHNTGAQGGLTRARVTAMCTERATESYLSRDRDLRIERQRCGSSSGRFRRSHSDNPGEACGSRS